MAEETVTIGDTEVRIEETDDGFKAEEASDPLDDFHGQVLHVHSGGGYGFKMPLGEALDGGAKVDTEKGYAVWDTDKDVSGMDSDGAAHAKRVLDPEPHQDGYASVGYYIIKSA